MIGRLVEQQQVGLAEQQPAQRNATSFAAREVLNALLAGWAAQCVHRVLGHALQVPRVGGIDLLLQARKLIRRLVRVVGGELVESLDERHQAADSLEHVVKHVLGGIELRLLVEQPDACPGSELRVATELAVAPGHDRQQARFAGAVVAEHTDLRAVEEGQRDVLEDLPIGRVDLAELVGLEDVFAGHRLAA